MSTAAVVAASNSSASSPAAGGAAAAASQCCPHPSEFRTDGQGCLPVEDEFICCVCGGVMLEPVIIPMCGHDFSLGCGLSSATIVMSGADGESGGGGADGLVDDAIGAAAVYKCPHSGCDMSFRQSDLRPAVKLTSLIGKLTVDCINSCGWVGQWAALPNHRDLNCPFELLPCPFDCGKLTPRDTINAHKKECLRRFEQCEHCLVSVRFQDRPLHESRCPLRPVTCSGCDTLIQSRGMEAHKANDCGGTLVSCPFEDFGCTVKGIPRRDVDAHIESNLNNHCLHLIAQIRKERLQNVERTRLMEARIRELEAQRGLSEAAHAQETDALLRSSAMMLQHAGGGGGALVPMSGNSDDASAAMTSSHKRHGVPPTTSRPASASLAGQRKASLTSGSPLISSGGGGGAVVANASMMTSSPLGVSVGGGSGTVSGGGKSATLALLESLESVVAVQQQVIDRFLCGSVLCVDARAGSVLNSAAGAGASGGNVVTSPTPSFPTINAALKAALPGDTIIIRPGTYKESVVLTTPNVWVRGAAASASGSEVVIEGCVSIKWPSSQPFFDTMVGDVGGGYPPNVTSGGVSSPLSLSAAVCGPTLGASRSGAAASGFNPNAIITDPMRLVPPSEALSNLALSNVTIRNVQDAVNPAIRVKCGHSNVYPRVQNCVIVSHNLACVVVDEGQPSFESCSMSESKQFGIFWRSKYDGSSSGAAGEGGNSTSSVRSVAAAVSSRKNSTASAADSPASGDGAALLPPASTLSEAALSAPFPPTLAGRIINCHVFNNKAPNIVVESGLVAIVNCTVEESAANGILVKSGSVAHIEGCTIRNNAFSNVDVLPNGTARIVSSLLHGSKKAGLYLTGTALIHTSRIFDNAMPNIVAMPLAVALLVNSKLNSSQQYGLVAKSTARVRLTGCEVKGNCFDNIVADPDADVDL